MGKIILASDYINKCNRLTKTTREFAQLGGYVPKGNIRNLAKINSEAMYYYKEILYGIIDLASQLGLTTNTELAYLFQFLLRNGYLSINHNYYEQIKSVNSIPNGMAVMSGVASEFNQTSMLENLFEISNREAYMIAVGHLEDYFKIYTTQLIFPSGSSFYTFDSGHNLYGRSNGKLDSKAPNGMKFKYSPFMTHRLVSNNVHMKLIRDEHPTKGATIRDNLRFSDGKLKAFNETESLVYLHNYLEQNRGFIEQFYRYQYRNISKVAEFVPSVR